MTSRSSRGLPTGTGEGRPKQGVSPPGPGCQPTASAAKASSQSGIPDAWTAHPMLGLIGERFAVLLGVLSARSLLRQDDVWGAVSGVVAAIAQGGEARRAEPVVSAREHPVGNADAPNPGDTNDPA